VKQPVERVAGLQVLNPLKSYKKILEEKKFMQQLSQSTEQPLLLTINQVMARLQLGRNKVYDLIKQEGLPVQYFGRAVRVQPDALEAWLLARGKKDNDL
jgi:excisionase family DNA binding protein